MKKSHRRIFYSITQQRKSDNRSIRFFQRNIFTIEENNFPFKFIKIPAKITDKRISRSPFEMKRSVYGPQGIRKNSSHCGALDSLVISKFARRPQYTRLRQTIVKSLILFYIVGYCKELVCVSTTFSISQSGVGRVPFAPAIVRFMNFHDAHSFTGLILNCYELSSKCFSSVFIVLSVSLDGFFTLLYTESGNARQFCKRSRAQVPRAHYRTTRAVHGIHRIASLRSFMRSISIPQNDCCLVFFRAIESYLEYRIQFIPEPTSLRRIIVYIGNVKDYLFGIPLPTLAELPTESLTEIWP